MRIINIIARIINILAAAALLLSYTAAYISPAKFWFVALIGLAYPILLIINILFVIYWAIQLKKYFLLSLTVILIRFDYVTRHFAFNDQQDEAKLELNRTENKTFKILTYNVGNYDIVVNKKNFLNTKAQILEIIKDQNPDIICLQEFLSTDRMNVIEEIKAMTQCKYHYFNKIINLTNIERGVIVFSKYPIIRGEDINFPNSDGNMAMSVDIKFNEDTVRIYNMHLESFRYKKDDYEFLKSPIKADNEAVKKYAKGFFKKTKLAFIERTKQVSIIKEHIENNPSKHLILCGDFNDTPVSYTYRELAENMQDVFVESGKGFGFSYARKMLYYRIDNILISESLTSANTKIVNQPVTEHLPLYTYISLKDNSTH